MNTVKGYKYTLQGHEDINEFARGILVMTNAMSSRKDTVIGIETLDGTNKVIVHSLIEIDLEVEAHFNKVISKEVIDVLQLDIDDLSQKPQKWIDKQGTSEVELAQDYFVTLPSNFFW